MVICQQRNIFKIRDKIPGHGPQKILCRYHHLYNGPELVLLACGCAISRSRLTLKEQNTLQNTLREYVLLKKRGPLWKWIT